MATLVCFHAHPDDEVISTGGTIARAAAEGHRVVLDVATNGDHGEVPEDLGPDETLADRRRAETEASARVLGIARVVWLGYTDSGMTGWDQNDHPESFHRADPDEAGARLAEVLRAESADVLTIYDWHGNYGHPDHIAVSQLALAGVMRAASTDEARDTREPVEGDGAPHRVEKVYCAAWTDRVWDEYQKTFKVLRSTVDGEARSAVSWPDWAVSATTDAHDQWETVWAAVQCHRTQMAQYGVLKELSPRDHQAIWGPQEFYRVFSLVNGGRSRERDLFEGLR